MTAPAEVPGARLNAKHASCARRLRRLASAGTAGLAALLVTGVFLWILADISLAGAKALSWSFLLDSPRDGGRAGGIYPILVSTAWLMAIYFAAAFPLSFLAAYFLALELDAASRAGRLIRRSLDGLAAVPSIVFGLFGLLFFAEILNFGFSILSGGLTLAIMVLPFMIRTSEAALSDVPRDQHLCAAALRLGRWTTLRRVLLPIALPGLVAGVILGLTRALAETAALIFTSGYVDRLPESMLDSGRALSVHVYDLALNVPGGNAYAFGTALVLVVALLILSQAGLILGGTRAIVRARP